MPRTTRTSPAPQDARPSLSPTQEADAVARWADVMAGLRRAPRQARARKTVAVLLDAAEEAIAEHGIERFTTGDIARITGLSIGTVYTYFDDRVAILDAIRPHRLDAAQTLEDVAARLQQFHQDAAQSLTADQDTTLRQIIDDATSATKGANADCR